MATFENLGLKETDLAGWEGEVAFESPGAGVVHSNLAHDGYQFARDIRIERIFLRSLPQKGKYPIPKDESFTLGSSDVTKMEDGSGPFLPKGKGPRGFYTPSFGYKQHYVKVGLLGEENQKIELTQEFLFTPYSNNPSHEPSGQVSAARFYPLLKFNAPAVTLENPDNMLQAIRVDYRMEFALDTMLVLDTNPHVVFPPGNMPTGNIGNNQVGIFQDHAAVTGIDLLRGGGRAVFARAEKPLIYEVVGRGLTAGVKLSWDNIHQWPGSSTKKLPPTPGLPHGVHIHWRWSTKEVVTFVKLGRKFAGVGGAGGPMLDPRIPVQDLEFAITKKDLADEVTQKYEKNRFLNFSGLFTSHGRRSGPHPISQGDRNLVIWISITAWRYPSHDAYIKGKVSGSSFEGTLFAHGLFFAHEGLLVLRDPQPRGDTGPQYIPSKPKQVWERP